MLLQQQGVFHEWTQMIWERPETGSPILGCTGADGVWLHRGPLTPAGGCSLNGGLFSYVVIFPVVHAANTNKLSNMAVCCFVNSSAVSRNGANLAAIFCSKHPF